jgi:hypothetical protein
LKIPKGGNQNRILKKNRQHNGQKKKDKGQRIIYKTFILSFSAKLQFLVGDIAYAFTYEFGIFYDVHRKMFLNKCFKLTSEILNDLS